MRTLLERFKPAVGRSVLLLISGLMWIAVGIMLIRFAVQWLSVMGGGFAYLLGAMGLVLSLLIHHFGLLKVADRNLARILPVKGKRCVFAFQPWKSYLIILLMVGMGIGLRHSGIPKPYLAIFYMAMGAALVLSSLRYLRVFIQQINRND